MTPDEKREALADVLMSDALREKPGMGRDYALNEADAILARFNVTARDEDDWEIGCMSFAHRSYGNPRGIVAIDPMIRPDEHGEECPSPFLVRRHPASEWEVFDA